MEKKLWIISTITIIVLFIGFIIYRSSLKSGMQYVELDKLLTTVKDSNYSIVHTGEKTDELEKIMKPIAKEYHMNTYYTDFNKEELNKIVGQYENLYVDSENQYIIFLKDKPVFVFNDDTSDYLVKTYLNKYLLNVIPEYEKKYKVLNTAQEYIDKVNSKEYTIAVFGYEKCSYCGLYLPVINEVADKYNVDIYYFDSDNYNETEMRKIKELDITIPAECTLNGKPAKFNEAYPKPMTVITRKGKLEGCIRGYVNEETVVNKLKELKIIK